MKLKRTLTAALVALFLLVWTSAFASAPPQTNSIEDDADGQIAPPDKTKKAKKKALKKKAKKKALKKKAKKKALKKKAKKKAKADKKDEGADDPTEPDPTEDDPGD